MICVNIKDLSETFFNGLKAVRRCGKV